jgi:predicted O-methyltransferase YrrM
MRAERRAIADDLYAASREHDAGERDRLLRFRNVEPATAELLALLVHATGALQLLEIGTSNGYSTLWLADAAEAGGGRLVSIEIDPRRTELARQSLARAGLGDVVELRVEDAAGSLAHFPDASFELVFLDAERPAYAGYWPDLVRVLVPRGLLVVDNAISHAHELGEFSALVEGDERVLSSLVPVGAGALLVVKAAKNWAARAVG